MKVGISLGLTVCTDPEMRNFARFGFDISDIDTDGDVKEQAEAGVAAMLTVFDVCDDGMRSKVSEALTDYYSLQPEGLNHELDQLRNSYARITTKLVPNIVDKVKEVDGRVKHIENMNTKLGPKSMDDVVQLDPKLEEVLEKGASSEGTG